MVVRLQSTYTVQIAWLECVKKIHMELYNEIVQETIGKAQTEAELDLIRLHKTFYAKLKKKKERERERKRYRNIVIPQKTG